VRRPGTSSHSASSPWPAWREWRPNQPRCWDASQSERCTTARRAYAVVDAVSRKWVAAHLTSHPDPAAARILFTRAIDNEGLLTDDLTARLADPGAELPDDDDVPLLLAISDNSTDMRANHTRRFTALCSNAATRPVSRWNEKSHTGRDIRLAGLVVAPAGDGPVGSDRARMGGVC